MMAEIADACLSLASGNGSGPAAVASIVDARKGSEAWDENIA